MAESERLMGRNGAWWRAYCRGETQESIAERYGVDRSTVSAAIAAVRDSIPQQDRAELLAQEIDYLRDLRRSVLTLYEDENGNLTMGAPVTAGKDGDVVLDPETGAVVRDHTGRLAAVRAALDITRLLHKATGLEASVKVEINAGEEQAARAAAADALSYLHGEAGDEG